MAPKGKKGDLCPTRESLMNSLERIKNIIDKKSNSLTIIELETRASMVESIFSDLNSVQMEIERDGDHQDFAKRHVYEDLYCEVKAKILNAIAEQNRRQDNSLNSTRLLNVSSNNHTYSSPRSLNLPKLKVPNFSGKYTDWLSWFNSFSSIIDNDPELDNLSKFIHLRSSLSPGPLRTIDCLELTADNYSCALSLLKNRFENKAHVRELFELPRLPKQSGSDLRNLVDSVNVHLRALKSLGTTEDLSNVFLYQLIYSKIDPETVKRWEDQFKCNELPSWSIFSSFLANRCTSLENRELNSRNVTCQDDKTKKPKAVSLITDPNKGTCPKCKGNHFLADCPTFLKLSPLQRYSEAKKVSLCVKCLVSSHPIRNCRAPQCHYCSGKHHTLLHRSEKATADEPSQPLKDNSETSSTDKTVKPTPFYTSLLCSTSVKFLATAIIFMEGRDKKMIECRAILDSGSQLNFVTQDLAKQLKCKLEPENLSISGIGNSQTKTLGKTQAVLHSRLTNFHTSASFIIIPSITQYSPNVSIDKIKWELPKNVELADPQFNESRKIDVLLGVSIFFNLLSVGQIRLGKSMPLLQKSLLGWVLAGEYSEPNYSSSLTSSKCEVAESSCAVAENLQLSNLVEHFWKCEEVTPSDSALTLEEQECESHFEQNVQRTLSGRFIVRLPFRRSGKGIGESYSIALKRFYNLERKLSRDSILKQEYIQFIKEYHDLGHLEYFPQGVSVDNVYFMPHHAVLRPESTSTKVRVVFDASCKSSNGLSLNDNLMVGPKIQPELFDILIRFRLYKYALTADISKMYRQILIHEADCNWQCILWRENESNRVQILRLKTVTYGTSSAPYLAVRCLKFLADQYKTKYTRGSKVLLQNFYMDDMLAGADTIDELLSLKREIIELLNLGRFELHKWRTNYVPDEKLPRSLDHEPLLIESTDCAKALGISWYSSQDQLSFSYSSNVSSKVTKRSVLSELAQLFDPLGLLNPIVVLGKLFMQELWLLQLDWDESVPQEFNERWQNYRRELALISEIKLPRYVFSTTPYVSIELHGFSDASTRAYGCAIYVRSKERSGKVEVRLLTAKSRIAPLKAISLPRLELQGAVLLTKLMHRIEPLFFNKPSRVCYWTDSMIVLSWLAAHSSRWKTFVANRVSLIQELTVRSNWLKVDSKNNPADIISRGMLPSQLTVNKLWFRGPEFLYLNDSEWPVERKEKLPQEIMGIEERQLSSSLVANVSPYEDLISLCKFAIDYLKISRVFGYIFRWVNNVRHRLYTGQRKSFSTSLSVMELRSGVSYILFNVQHVTFMPEIQALQFNKSINSSKIQKLNPFLDTCHNIPILRVGGRLVKSNLQFTTKHPILLPNNHMFSLALATFLHKINSHIGPLGLLAFTRQRFWILNGRKLTNKVVRSCISCFKYRPKPLEQIMGNLPSDRIGGHTQPFQKAGMDFAGPISIHFKLRGKRPVKAYLALFICFLTKACHLEVVSDLSTQAFLCALKRFFARRGLSSDLYCDNATNFTGAARVIAKNGAGLFDDTDKTQIVDDCAAKGVTFHFIPPRSPHMGGLWESAIKVAKTMIAHHINGASLTFEELTTVAAEVEAIMNSRPIAEMSSDPNDFEALTPGHFLIGRPLNSLPEPAENYHLEIPLLNRWKRIQHIKTIFWQRWSKEYVLSLQKRLKWKTPHPNVEVGTLVLVADDNLPSYKWPLGRVEGVNPGDDGLIRVVTIRTSGGGIIKRNINKICPVPQDNEQQNFQ